MFTSIHEVWPGHFLNFMHANRAPWLYGRAFVSYAYAEGWAHYTEEMMLEAGLPDCCGVAVGFDRVVMLGLGLEHLDQVISFPS